MPIALDFFVKYGYWVIFLWVLTEQLGIPIPSAPLMLTAGTLTATHRLNLPFVLLAAFSASLIADTTWYVFGKRYGSAVVRLMCRLSLESTACVRKTEGYFTRRGATALLVAKFVPGLGSVAAPIAGQIGMGYGKFVLCDAAGVMLWFLTVTLGGRFFGDVLNSIRMLFPLPHISSARSSRCSSSASWSGGCCSAARFCARCGCHVSNPSS